MSLEEKIRRYEARHCGQVSKASPPLFDKVNKHHIAFINARYPVYIFDDRNPSEYKIRILNFDNIGKVVFNEKEEIVPPLSATSEMLSDNIEAKLKQWRINTENIVVSCSAEQLVKIEEFKHHLRPFADIYEMLVEHDRITEYDIKAHNAIREKERFKKYLVLLEGLDFIRLNDGYYEAANQLIGIEKDVKSGLNLYLSLILKSRYTTLRDVFKLTIFEKTVGVENVVYMPELELEDSIYRTEKSIILQYAKYYGKKVNPIKANGYLKMLERSGAIKFEDNHYFGDDTLRKHMINEKENLEINQLSKYR